MPTTAGQAYLANPLDLVIEIVAVQIVLGLGKGQGNRLRGGAVSKFGPQALRKLGEFYTANANIIERNRVQTLDFASGEATGRKYTRAKVIDMIFFVAGGS